MVSDWQTDRPTDLPTDRPTDIATYRAAIAAKKRIPFFRPDNVIWRILDFFLIIWNQKLLIWIKSNIKTIRLLNKKNLNSCSCYQSLSVFYLYWSTNMSLYIFINIQMIMFFRNREDKHTDKILTIFSTQKTT